MNNKVCVLYLWLFGVSCNINADVLTAQDQQQLWSNTINYGQTYNSSDNAPSNVIQGNSRKDSISNAQQNLNRFGTTDYNLAGSTAATQSNVMDGNSVNNATKQQYQTIKDADSGNQNAIMNNSAQAQMTTCLNANNPECQAVNKYNDDETQGALQNGSMGSGNYYFSQLIRSDPSNQSCSKRIYYQPINPQNYSCQVGNATKKTCKASLSVWIENVKDPDIPVDGTTLATKNSSVPWSSSSQYQCNTNDGSCNQYSNNPQCSFVSQTCSQYTYQVYPIKIPGPTDICSAGSPQPVVCNANTPFSVSSICMAYGQDRRVDTWNCDGNVHYQTISPSAGTKTTIIGTCTNNAATYSCSSSSNLILTANAVSYNTLTKLNQVKLNVSASFLGINASKSVDQLMNSGSILLASNSGSAQNGNKTSQVVLPITLSQASCNGTICQMTIVSTPTVDGATATSTSVTLQFTKPIAGSTHEQTNYEYNDGCANYR